MFRGSIPALITPFQDGNVDEKALKKLVEWQVSEGSHGLVPTGTTGESPTLSHEEHDRVVKIVVEAADKRLPVIAGTGSNNTAEAITMSQHAQESGADGLLLVAPYYNKPTQEGMYAHFKAIHDETDLPIILYNIPGRSVVRINTETMAELNKLPRIIGVKDATADITCVSDERMVIGDDWVQLSGEDGTALGYLAQGGNGCISVTANVAPRLCAEVQDAWAAGDSQKALAAFNRLYPLHKSLFVEPNPGPVKYAAERLGLCSAEMRLPMVPVSDATKALVDDALRHAGLID